MKNFKLKFCFVVYVEALKLPTEIKLKQRKLISELN